MKIAEFESLTPYSLGMMHADADGLRGMATRPGRFAFGMERKRNSRGEPLPDHVLDSRGVAYLRHGTSRTPFQFHRLLPGGRWLLTGSSDDSVSHLCCWDLRNPSSLPLVHEFRNEIAIFDGIEGDDSAVICQLSENGREVVILVRTCSGEGEYVAVPSSVHVPNLLRLII
jgi:hypothetical protein